jgi:hypothetical protein
VYPEIETSAGSSAEQPTSSSSSHDRPTVPCRHAVITSSGVICGGRWPEVPTPRRMPASTRTQCHCAPPSRNPRHRPVRRERKLASRTPFGRIRVPKINTRNAIPHTTRSIIGHAPQHDQTRQRLQGKSQTVAAADGTSTVCIRQPASWRNAHSRRVAGRHLPPTPTTDAASIQGTQHANPDAFGEPTLC